MNKKDDVIICTVSLFICVRRLRANSLTFSVSHIFTLHILTICVSLCPHVCSRCSDKAGGRMRQFSVSQYVETGCGMHQPAVQWVQEVKWPGPKAEHSPSYALVV